MSMAGGNPSLIIDTLVNNGQLGAGLAQAEAQVLQSTTKMARNVDAQMGRVADTISKKIASALVMGVAVQGLDQAFRAAVEQVKAGGTFQEAGIAFGEGIEKSLRSIPIAGGIGGAIADAVLYGLNAALDYIPQFAKDFDRRLSELFGDFVINPISPFIGILSGLEDRRAEERKAASQQTDAATRQAEARIRDAQLRNELERMQQGQQAMLGGSPLEQQIAQMAGRGGQSFETALGTFRFGGMDATAQIVEAAREQIRILDAIKNLQQQIADNQKLIN